MSAKITIIITQPSYSTYKVHHNIQSQVLPSFLPTGTVCFRAFTLCFSSEHLLSESVLMGLRNLLKYTVKEGRVNMAAIMLLMQQVLIWKYQKSLIHLMFKKYFRGFVGWVFFLLVHWFFGWFWGGVVFDLGILCVCVFWGFFTSVWVIMMIFCSNLLLQINVSSTLNKCCYCSLQASSKSVYSFSFFL